MIFNSLAFIVFFAVVYALYRVLPNWWRRMMVLAASYVFYGWFDWRYVSLLLLSSAGAYCCALALDRPSGGGRRAWLIAGVTLNLGILGVFKYFNFFAGEVNQVLSTVGLANRLPLTELILPVGLSFFTFQSISYIVDVYRGRTPACRNVLDVSLFIAFFPQLMAGPIERASHLMPQLQAEPRWGGGRMAEGTQLVIWGYYRKLFVADNLAALVAMVYDNPGAPNGLHLLIATYAFSWQVYCDFAGYTDIARGLARWMGVDLVRNFRLPYFASSPADFWQRWHISLSSWLRDYLYIPLGGSRRGRWRYHLSLMATMLLGGLWHGASWNFIIWGGLHGVLLMIQHQLPAFTPTRLGRTLGIIFTFHMVCLANLFFRAHDMTQAWGMLSGMTFDLAATVEALKYLPNLLLPIHMVLLVELAQYLRGQDEHLPVSAPVPLQLGLNAVLLASIFLLGSTYGLRFIYFQF